MRRRSETAGERESHSGLSLVPVRAIGADFLTRYGLEGGSHHQTLAYGHKASAAEKVVALLGIPFVRV